MAVKLKANVQYQPIVESVSRKFVPKKETCKAGGTAGPVTFMTSGWMGGAVRTTGRAGLGACSKNYLVIRVNARQTAPSSNEIDNRELFSAVAKAVPVLLKNLSQITTIMQLYAQCRDDSSKSVNGVYAYGYTLKGWVWAVQFAGKKNDENYNLSQFPQSVDA